MRTDEGVCPYFEADSLINERDLLQFRIHNSKFKIMISSVVEKRQKVLCCGIFNTEYTDSTKPEGDTEFLKEHEIPQKQTPKCNSKFKVHNSKL